MLTVTPAEYQATAAKVAKINERAAKRGFTGRLELVAEKFTVESNDLGFPVVEVFYKVSITGEAPKYDGWTFLARIDAVADTFTIATAPGVEHVSRDHVRVGECDHCQSNRARKNTYLVQGEDGLIRNVGSTCIKDFLGWDANVTFLSVEDVEKEISAGISNIDRTFTVDAALAVAIAVTKVCGFVSTQAYGESTASRVSAVLHQSRVSPAEESTYNEIRAIAPQAIREVEAVKSFILSPDFAGTSTYVDNLKALVEAGEVTARQIGLIASAPQALTKHRERLAGIEAQAKVAATSEYIGEVKDKIQVTGVITAIRYIDGQYGTTTLYTILTDQGLVKWFSSNGALGDDIDKVVTIKGTVKAHDEYNGIKSTVLTRCKEV